MRQPTDAPTRGETPKDGACSAPPQQPRARIAPLLGSFRAAADDVPAALLDARARERLERIVPGVPDAASVFGFECRLEAGAATVDLGVAVAPENGGCDVLAGRAGDVRLERAVASDVRWRRIRDLARRWSIPSGFLHTWVPFLFLEYDASGAATFPPVPSVFLALDAPVAGAAEPVAAEQTSPVLQAAREAAALLAGQPLAAALDEQLARAFAVLPEHAWILHLGLLLGRGGGVRLSVAVRDHVEAAAYLRRLGGAAAADAVAAAADRLGDALPATQLDFDLAPAVEPRVGLGLRPSDTEEWNVLLNALEASGWCSPDKASALLAWPGRRLVWIAEERFLLQRALSHAKLVCTAGQATRAKAYFGATPFAAPAGR